MNKTIVYTLASILLIVLIFMAINYQNNTQQTQPNVLVVKEEREHRPWWDFFPLRRNSSIYKYGYEFNFRKRDNS